MGTSYCTREDVQNALDMKSTARDDAQVDRLIQAASRNIEALCHRRFAPTLSIRYIDWPNPQFGRAYSIWLDQHECISLSSVVSGGVTISPSNYFLEPANSGPPFNSVEINIGTTAGFDTGSTHQHDIVLTGLFGYSDDADAAGTLVGAITNSDVQVTVSDGSLVGVGSVLRIDSERMYVSSRSWVSSTQSLQADMAAAASSVTVSVTDGTAFHAGEVLLIDSERVLITDVAGNNLVVKRAWDGSVLALHTGSLIYASRKLTVIRAALGTTAAAHSNAAVLTTWAVPAPVRALCIAETLNAFEQENSAYARVIGSGDHVRNASGGGLDNLRDQVYASHGRKNRTRVV